MWRTAADGGSPLSASPVESPVSTPRASCADTPRSLGSPPLSAASSLVPSPRLGFCSPSGAAETSYSVVVPPDEEVRVRSYGRHATHRPRGVRAYLRHLRNNHVLLSACCAHPEHPLTRQRRWTVLFSSCAFAFFVSSFFAVFLHSDNPPWWAFWEWARYSEYRAAHSFGHSVASSGSLGAASADGAAGVGTDGVPSPLGDGASAGEVGGDGIATGAVAGAESIPRDWVLTRAIVLQLSEKPILFATFMQVP